MKRLSALLAVVVMFVVGTSVFAQPFPRGAEMQMNAIVERNVAKKVAAAEIVNNILTKGTKVSFDYWILKSIPNKNSFGFHDVTRNFVGGNGMEWSDGKHVYLLLSRDTWEDELYERMPCGLYRTFRGDKIKKQTITISKGKVRTTYFFFKNALLNHNHYEVNGREYTVITLK